jgi:AraC-like DNA-binding protein
MQIVYNVEYIKKIQKDFYNSTGININFLDEKMNSLCQDINGNSYCSIIHTNSTGIKRCFQSDRILLEKCKESGQMEVHTCHAGLIDVALPIKFENHIVGFVILGQMKGNEEFSNTVGKSLSYLGKEKLEEIKLVYKTVPTFNKERIKSIVNIAVMVAKYIMQENMVTVKHDAILEKILTYIDSNIEKNINVSDLIKVSNISKSSLYGLFNRYYNCSVCEYIKNRKIEKAKSLLMNTDLSVSEISAKLGFSTLSYFSKTFKRINGVSPQKYKKTEVIQNGRKYRF